MHRTGYENGAFPLGPLPKLVAARFRKVEPSTTRERENRLEDGAVAGFYSLQCLLELVTVEESWYDSKGYDELARVFLGTSLGLKDSLSPVSIEESVGDHLLVFAAAFYDEWSRHSSQTPLPSFWPSNAPHSSHFVASIDPNESIPDVLNLPTLCQHARGVSLNGEWRGRAAAFR